MRWRPIVVRALLATATVLLCAPVVWAQRAPAGVAVDTAGVLRTQSFADPTGELSRRRIAEAKAALKASVAKQSGLRKISLNRLEKAIEAEVAAGREPTDEMRYLAGLIRLKHVFFYPQTGDIVIAGEAEGWATDLSGRVIGVHSARPMIQLQDLVVALRCFPPGKPPVPMIGCSIDATKEGLDRMQAFLHSIGSKADPRDPAYTKQIVDGLRSSLGLQEVRIDGVPPDTHFAQVLVEADYRMKLIGIGLETAPVKIVSYVDRANPASASRNAIQRWWFVPHYDCVRASDDGLAMELVGRGVKLLNADEVVGPDGQRQQSTSADQASAAFVEGFTKQYPELARKHPVYAQLRNLIDVAVAAAFIQQQGYYDRAGWTMSTLGDEEKLPVQTYRTPVAVESAVSARWKGTRLLTPVGGGVVIYPGQALRPANRLPDESGDVAKTRQQIDLRQLAEGQWWWD